MKDEASLLFGHGSFGIISRLVGDAASRTGIGERLGQNSADKGAL